MQSLLSKINFALGVFLLFCLFVPQPILFIDKTINVSGYYESYVNEIVIFVLVAYMIVFLSQHLRHPTWDKIANKFFESFSELFLNFFISAIVLFVFMILISSIFEPELFQLNFRLGQIIAYFGFLFIVTAIRNREDL